MKTHTRSTKCQYRPAISTPCAPVFPMLLRTAVMIKMISPDSTFEPWNDAGQRRQCATRTATSMTCIQSPLQHEEQEQERDPEAGQEAPVGGKHAEAVLAGRVREPARLREHHHEPDEAPDQVHAVD